MLPSLSAIMIFLALEANDNVSYLPLIGEYYLPNYAIYCFIALASIHFLICFIGILAALVESKILTEIYMFL